MPKSKIVIHILHEIKILVNGTDYSEQAIDYKIVNEANKLDSFEITLIGIEAEDRDNIAENKIVVVKYANKLILKGLVQKAKYKSGYEVTITGYGYGESLLKEKLVETTASADSSSPAGRPIYDGVDSATIVSEQLASESVSIGTNTSLGKISIRGDFDSKISFLAGVASLGKGDWWFSYGSSPDFSDCKFNIAPSRGSGSSVKTFNISGSSQNATATSYQADYENVYNSVTCLGAGDGNNQLRTKAIAAVNDKTTLNMSSGYLNITDTTITVADASVLPSSGSVWIGAEKVNYTGKSGNDLTGCTRWTSGGIITTEDKKYKHYNGVEVYDASYTESSPESGSSIDSYGLKTYVLVDRSIISRHALDMAAQNFLNDHKNLVKRISVEPSDYKQALYDLNVGDTITIVDEETGLNGDYVIHALVLSSSKFVAKLEIQVSNAPSALSRELKETKGEVTALKQYLQGSTAIQSVSIYENCDSSHPLYLRFRMPSDVVAVTKALLNWRIKDYRAYTKTSGSNTDSTIASVMTDALGTVSVGTNWMDLVTSDPYVDGFETIFYNWFRYQSGNTSDSIYLRVYDQTNGKYSPDDNGIRANIYDDEYAMPIIVPWNTKGHTLILQAKTTSGLTISYDSRTIVHGTHSHSMNYGIDRTAGGHDATVSVAIGEDGSETSYTPQNNGIDEDISDRIASIGAGKTVSIKITPNKACRIEADYFGKVFIESR